MSPKTPIVDFLHDLRTLNIKLRIDDDQLRYTAPKGALTPSLRSELAVRKDEIIAFLREATARTITTLPLQPTTRNGPVPLALSQQRIWFLAQLMPESPAYNMPAAVRLSGRLDVEALQHSLNAIVARHEALRTTCIVVDGQPAQRIGRPYPVNLRVIDARSFAGPDQSEAARQVIDAECQQPFDLERGPLLRAALIRLAETEHILLLTLHHIIADGWSLGVLIRELAAFYRANREGRDAMLPALPIQYPDYAVWQRQPLQEAALAAQLGYWMEHLADAPFTLDLPTDYPRPAQQSFHGARQRFLISPALTAAVHALSQRANVTLFMTLLTAWQVLLARYSNQLDLCVGTPVANRTQAVTEELIGCFVNTLVLRGDLRGNPTFYEMLARTRTVTLDAFAHQEVPFEKLVAALQPGRSFNHPPLVQVMFALQNMPMPPLRLDALTLEQMETSTHTAKFDLTLTMTETPDGLTGTLEYATSLFSTTATQMAAHFQTLLTAIVADPDQRLMDLPILSMAERQFILGEYNQTHACYPIDQCLHQLVQTQSAHTPDAIALIYDERCLTYQELNQRANQVAHYLQSNLNIGPESRVGLCLERSPELVVVLLGILKAGACYVPIDPTYPAARRQFMIDDSRAAVLITEALLFPPTLDHSTEIICMDDIWPLLAHYPTSDPLSSVMPANLAYVIYTSGSTGSPKGVAVTHESVCNHLYWRQARFPLTAGDRFLHKASFGFDISVWECFAPLQAGATLILAPFETTRSSTELVRLMAKRQVTVFHAGPSLLQQILDEPELDACSGVRHVFCGGEALSWKLQARCFSRLHAQLHHQYGPTETCIDATIWECQPNTDDHGIPVGRPIANTACYILDAQHQPLPCGVVGELYIGGISLARGYLDQPALTAERFIPNPFSGCPQGMPGTRLYRTGDLARYRPDGVIELRGRVDHQVKIRGYRIEVGEIEATLARLAALREVVVVAQPTPAGDRQLVAYLVAQSDAPPSVSALRAALATTLPDYMVPSAFVFLDALPLTSSGKLDRKALPLPERAEYSASIYVAPRTPEEAIVAEIWAKVLGVSSVSANDNFFEIGGHSLKATQVIARLRDTIGIELPVRAFFAHPTLDALAVQVGELSRKAPGLEAIPIRCNALADSMPLSFSQRRLWLLDQIEPGNPTYNITGAVQMVGRLNTAALAQSLNAVIERHDALRTIFVNGGSATQGEPVQIIQPMQPMTPPVSDLRDLAPAARAAEVQQRMLAEARQPFDLACGPLLRVSLLQLGNEEHILLVAMHHIVSDGWSIGVFMRELATFYNLFAHGKRALLPELPIQYSDFAVWQRKWLTGQVLEQQMAYWKEQLHGELPVLELPTDHPRQAVQTFNGAIVPLCVSDKLHSGLQLWSRQQGVTLYMTLLAGFQVLLHRYTDQTDVLIGSPIANRNRAETENLIGCFVNTLVLRTNLAGNPTFCELIQRVREVALGAYAHQDLPFEKLVEELQPERSLSRTPFFQVVFVLQNTPGDPSDLDGITLTPLAIDTATAKFDLTLFFREEEGQLKGEIEYNTDLFDRRTIARMADHLMVLLTSMISDPTQPIADLPLLTAEEQQMMLVEWNASQVDYPREAVVHQLFEAQVTRTPERTAVVYAGQTLTYAELNARANQVAHFLRAQGVAPDQLVALALERSLDMLVGMLGILKAGAAYVPLDPEYPADRLAFMLQDTQAPVLLTQQSLLPKLSQLHWVNNGLQSKIVALDAEWPTIAAFSTANPDRVTEPEHRAYVIYTSGSTGRPKGVMVQQRGLVNLVWGLRAYFDDPEVQTTGLITSISFDISVNQIFPTLLFGRTLHIIPDAVKLDARRLFTYLGTTQIQLLDAVPSFLQAQLAEIAPETMPTTLRYLLIGGEKLESRLLQAIFDQLGARIAVVNIYGLTEITDINALGVIRQSDLASPVTVGRPLQNNRIYVINQRLQPQPVAVVGEVCISGESLSRGYLHRPELTAEKFIVCPFENGALMCRTGDLGRWTVDGQLEILGRVDHQVKIRGYRIEVGEIEATLARLAALREVVVVAQPTPAGDRQLVAYLVAQSDAPPSVSALRAALATTLPDYMVPSSIMLLDHLPRTPNGKIDRKALPLPEFVGSEAEPAYVAPKTPDEELVAYVWMAVLGLERVSVTMNFFALGGHSLLAAQIMSRLRKMIGIELPLRMLFEYPTIAGLAKCIEESRQRVLGLEAPPIKQRTASAALPLSFSQQRLWLLDQIEPGNPAYNLPGIVSLKGRLNVVALEQSLNAVVARHEALRTIFAQETAGHPLQVILPELHIPLSVVDLRHLAIAERETEVQRLMDEAVQQPFVLQHGPLLRVMLLRLADEEHILVFTLHHIVGDGWSLSVFVREVTTFYAGYSTEQVVVLPELPIQYADFAIWQREWLDGAVLKRQLNYWKNQLAGDIPMLDLPTDRPRTAVRTFKSGKETLRLPLVQSEELRRLTQRTSTTLYMTLLAAFQTLLYRYTGQTDICVGTPIANRTRDEMEDLIGFFLNTLVLRTNLEGNPTFQDLLGRVREVALGAYTHQDLPFEKLLDEIQPERSLSHTPLFQVFFNMLNFPEIRLDLPGMTVETLVSPSIGSKFDLTLYVQDQADGINFDLVYNARLFKPDRMRELLRQFQILLEQVTADPTMPIDNLSLVTPEAQRLLPDPTAPLDASWHGSVPMLFARQAQRRPHHPAVVDGRSTWSYEDLDQRSNRLANCLIAHGIQPQEVVVIYARRNAALVWAILGVLKAGAAYAILDPAYPAARLIDHLEIAQPRGWIALEGTGAIPAPVEEWLSQATLCVRTSLPDPSQPAFQSMVMAYSAIDPNIKIGPDDAAVIGFTSGSTGKPKAIIGRHGPLTHFLPWQQAMFGQTEDDRYSMISGLSHDPLQRDTFTPLCTGATICIPEPADIVTPGRLAVWMQQQKITVAHLTPALSQILAEIPSDMTPVTIATMRYAFIVGDVLTLRDVGRIRALAPAATCVNFYGSTETQRAVAYYLIPNESVQHTPAESRVKEILPLGRGIQDVQLLVLNAAQQQAGIGEVGEIHIRSPHLAAGYLGDPALTQARFLSNFFLQESAADPSDRLYRTGDLGRYRPDGTAEFVGRADQQVKIRGFRVELGEIEAVLGQYPGVRDVIVIMREDLPGMKRLVAYVVAHADQVLRIPDLRHFLDERLPSYMVPAAFVLLQQLPVTPNGKVDRRSLPKPEELTRSITEGYIAPRTHAEQIIAAIWQNVLQIEQVAVSDNFFDLGGNSLHMVQVHSKLRESFERELPMIEMFKYPTVGALATYLSQEQSISTTTDSLDERIRKQNAVLNHQKQLRTRE